MQLPQSVSSILERAGLGAVPRRTVVVFVALCLCAAGWGSYRWMWRPSDAIAVSDVSEPDASWEGSASSASETTETVATASPTEVDTATVPPATLFVHVVGAVLRPGVYELAEGSRIADAVSLAGGLSGNAAESAVNLARELVDGEQIAIPTKDEWATLTEGAATPTGEGVTGGSSVAAGALGVPDPQAPPADASGAAAAGDAAKDAPATEGGSAFPIDVNAADATTLEALPGIGPSLSAAIVEDRSANGSFGTVDDLLRVSGIGDKKLEAIRDLVVVG